MWYATDTIGEWSFAHVFRPAVRQNYPPEMENMQVIINAICLKHLLKAIKYNDHDFCIKINFSMYSIFIQSQRKWYAL